MRQNWGDTLTWQTTFTLWWIFRVERQLVVQSLSHVGLFLTQWASECEASLSFTISGVCSNSCPLSQWCYPTISSSVTPFSWCPQSFPASGSFPISQLFASGGQSIGASASASILPMNIQGLFPLGMTGLTNLISLCLKNLLQHHNSKASVLQHSAFWMVQLSYLYMTVGKIIALTIQTFIGKVISLLFNILSRFVISFLPSVF